MRGREKEGAEEKEDRKKEQRRRVGEEQSGEEEPQRREAQDTILSSVHDRGAPISSPLNRIPGNVHVATPILHERDLRADPNERKSSAYCVWQSVKKI